MNTDFAAWQQILEAFKTAVTWPSPPDSGPLRVVAVPSIDFGYDITDDDGLEVSIAEIVREAGDQLEQYGQHPKDYPDRGIVNDDDRANLERQLQEIEAAIAHVRSLYNDAAKKVEIDA
jgi:hypothetical protein